VDIISDVKGEDIVLLDLREVTPIADFFVICTGNSERQLKAIVEKISETIREEHRIKPYQVEGSATGGWVLLDYGTVVIHAFAEVQRDYYDLEELWSAGKTLLRMQ
jgi:ribosome-associated protein